MAIGIIIREYTRVYEGELFFPIAIFARLQRNNETIIGWNPVAFFYRKEDIVYRRTAAAVLSWRTVESWECVRAKDDIRFLDKVFAWSRSRERQPETARPWARTRVILRHWFLPGFLAVVAATTKSRRISFERIYPRLIFPCTILFNSDIVTDTLKKC